MITNMKKVVTIGGGTGSYTVLTGIKEIPNIDIKALVSMADDGGSTGILMDDLGILPPGDVRQCLVALSEHSDIVRELIKYRFSEGTLRGHNFGNIFLAGLEKVTGDFISGLEIASDILKVQGKVIPITNNKAVLSMKLANGKVIEGEHKINHSNIQGTGIAKIFYKNKVKLNISAEKAIRDADYIILGPGNYYCSVLPNLIVDGFIKAIKKSKAKLIFPVNLTNKNGHTKYWGVREYTEDIEKYLGKKVDIILVNNISPSRAQIAKYKLQEGDGVMVLDNLDNTKVLRKPLLSRKIVKFNKADAIQNVRSFIRHDSQKIAEAIRGIIFSKK